MVSLSLPVVPGEIKSFSAHCPVSPFFLPPPVCEGGLPNFPYDWVLFGRFGWPGSAGGLLSPAEIFRSGTAGTQIPAAGMLVRAARGKR